MLKSLSDYYPQDCRVYIYLAFTSYDKNSSEVSMYCRKAHELFITATDDVSEHVVFNSDGSITETFTDSYSNTATKITVFNSDGSITSTIS